MNLFGMMDTSGAAMQAERMRAEVVAANMANAETTHTAAGGPYKRQHVVFSASQGDPGFLDSLATAAGTSSTATDLLPSGLGGAGAVAPGVQITGVVEDTAPPLVRYDPGHPDAGADGFVAYPDINPLTEMVDLMGATRAYGLNSSAVQAEKAMITAALEIAKS
jgi:flagellar basal-body rod protein FlgC